MVKDVIKWHWGPPASKMSNWRYQNKDRLSVYLHICRILLLQRRPKLGRMRPAGWTQLLQTFKTSNKLE